MKNFDLYAQYYDLLYNDKDYHKEANYIHSLISSFASSKSNLVLELGCGTGIHAALLSHKGYKIDGLDISPEMIQRANEKFGKDKNLSFKQADIRKFNLKRKYPVIISLFHVMSYQTRNEDLLHVFKNVKKHLTPGGVFIFDCWHGPGVLTDLPKKRIKNISNDAIEVTRLATPEIHFGENVVDVNFRIKVAQKHSKKSISIKEIHKMRYLFQPEILMFAEQSKMRLIKSYNWLTRKEISNNWNMVCVLRNI